MLPNVFGQQSRAQELLATPFARVYIARHMHQHMLVQMRLMRVRFLANYTGIHSVGGVYLRVCRQTRCLCELLITLIAAERLLARMDSHVRIQAARLRERFLTNAAGERFLARVIFHVLHQLVRLLERRQTYRTLIQIGVGVREPMFGQQGGRFKFFIAVRTWKRITVRVHSHVQQQAARVDETFFAYITLMRFTVGMAAHVNH